MSWKKMLDRGIEHCFVVKDCQLLVGYCGSVYSDMLIYNFSPIYIYIYTYI
jgi:hypothetical protein